MQVLCRYKLNIFVTICHQCLPNLGYHFLFVWMPTYLSNDSLRKSDDYVIKNPYIINIFCILTEYVFMIIGGLICDRFKNITNKFMIFFGLLFVLACIFLLPIVDSLDNTQLIEIIFILCFLSALYGLYHAGNGVWPILYALPNVETRFSGYVVWLYLQYVVP